MIEQIILIVGIILLGVWALKKLRDDFSQELFFKIGFGLFTIQALANSWGLIIDWPILLTWARISRTGALIFTFLIAYFFLWMAKQSSPKTSEAMPDVLTEQQMEEFLGK